MNVAMTIAGSDSSGGAGIQADLKTFTRLGVFGITAVTAITAQNTTGVRSALELPVDLVRQQIDFTVEDIRPDACKTGMLASVAIIECVAEALRRHRPPNYVCDPVMVAKSGAPLISDDAIDTLRSRLLPLAALLTPNRFEAARLAGLPTVEDEPTARDAAHRLLGLGARAVVVKGIRVDQSVVDLLVTADGAERLESPRLPDGRNHGSGCTFSAAVTARLAQRDALSSAVRFAHDFVHRAVAQAPALGRGVRPVNVLNE